MRTHRFSLATWAFALIAGTPCAALADLRVVEENAPTDESSADASSAQQASEPARVDEGSAEANQGVAALITRTTAPAPSTEVPPATPPSNSNVASNANVPVAAPATTTTTSGEHRYLDLTGFLQPGFIARFDSASDGISAGITDDTFWLQRARIGVRAQMFEWLRARIEVEFSPVTLLQDAYVDIVPHPAFNVRIGQMVVPFLQTFRFNELNLAFLDRATYTPQRPDRDYIRYLSPRDVGVMLSGRIGESASTSHDPVFEYSLGGFIGRGPNIALNDDGVFLFTGRLQLHALGVPDGIERENDLARNNFPRATVAVGAYSNCDDRSNWNRGFTVDLEGRYQGLFASAAFVWMRNSATDGSFLANSNDCRGQPSGPGETLDFVSRGGHVQLQYVVPRMITGGSSVLGPLADMDLEVLARLDWVDAFSPYVSGDPLFGGGPNSPGYVVPANYSDSDNPPTRWRLTFGINWFPTGQNQLRLGINYQLNRESEDVVTGAGTYRGVSNDILWFQATVGL